MQEGKPTKHQIERCIRAIEHSMELKPLEKPEVVVYDKDSDTGEGHIVNLDEMTCTCKDFEFNCDDGEYCKHQWRVVLEKHGMIQR